MTHYSNVNIVITATYLLVLIPSLMIIGKAFKQEIFSEEQRLQMEIDEFKQMFDSL